MKTREIKLAVDPTQKNIKMQNFTFPSYKQPEKPRGISDTHQLISVADNRALYLFGRQKRGYRCCGMYNTFKYTHMYAVAHFDPSSKEISQVKEAKIPIDICTISLAPNKQYYITATDKELFKVTLEGDELKFESFMPLTLPYVDTNGLKRRYYKFVFLSDTMLLIAHADARSEGPKHINLINLEEKKCIKTFYVSSLDFEKINQKQFAVLQTEKIYIFDITKTETLTIEHGLKNTSFIALNENRLVIFGYQPIHPYDWYMQTYCLTTGEKNQFPVYLNFMDAISHLLFASPSSNQWCIAYREGSNLDIHLAGFEWGETNPFAKWIVNTYELFHPSHHCYSGLFWNPLEPRQLISPGSRYDFSSIDFYSSLIYEKYLSSFAGLLTPDVVTLVMDYLAYSLESRRELDKECKQIKIGKSASAFFQPAGEEKSAQSESSLKKAKPLTMMSN